VSAPELVSDRRQRSAPLPHHPSQGEQGLQHTRTHRPVPVVPGTCTIAILDQLPLGPRLLAQLLLDLLQLYATVVALRLQALHLTDRLSVLVQPFLRLSPSLDERLDAVFHVQEVRAGLLPGLVRGGTAAPLGQTRLQSRDGGVLLPCPWVLRVEPERRVERSAVIPVT